MMRRWLWLTVATLVLSLGTVGLAQVGPDYEDPWAEARTRYNAGDYAVALRFTIEAAQRDPEEPRYYLGIARSYFQLGQHDNAVWYYDVYLSLVGDRPFTGSASYHPDRARAERESAAAARGARAGEAVSRPLTEVEVRQALLARIEAGPALSETEGGAWATWQALLRSGYANPDLTELRAALVAALLREAESLFDVRAARVPHLSFEEWLVQALRYERACAPISLPVPAEGGAPAEVPPLPAGWHFAQGMRAYLQQDGERAVASFEAALQQDPALLPAHVALLNAQLARHMVDAAALRATHQRFEAAVRDETLRSFYAAAVRARLGDLDGAAAALIELLRAR